MKQCLRSRFQVFWALALVGFAVYANAIQHPFVHDDVVFIQQNPNISRWDNIADAFLRPSAPSAAEAIRIPYYRPLLEVVYRLEFSLFGMHSARFHFFNIALHILNAFLVFLLGTSLRLLRSWSFCVALIFLVHPVQSEAVACISGISNLTAALFCLGTILSYLRAREPLAKGMKAWSFLTVILFVVALFSKEQAVAVPIIILVYEFLWRKESFQSFSKWALLASLFWILAAYLFWRQVIFPGMMTGAFENSGELVLRFASIPRTILDYLGVVFWPSDLHYYRSVDILSPKLLPTAWFISVVCLVMTVCLVLVGRLGRWAWFGVAWFIAALVPVLNIVPLINEYSFILTAEHFLYLPLVGILIFCAAAVGWASRTMHGEISLLVWRGVFLVILGLFAVMTVRQNFFWRGEVPLFERTLVFEPGFGRVHLLLARAYAGSGRFPEALGEYARGLRIMEDYVKKARLSKAQDVYLDYVQEAHFERAECYRAMGRLPESTEEYLWTLGMKVASSYDVSGRASRAANNLALNFIRMGDRERAKRFFELAVRLDPRSVEAMNNLGLFFSEEGQRQTAIFWFEQAIKRDPLFHPAWENLKRVQNF